ncbi:MAG TPA: GGDEF domain-containing protein [Gaiellaceae bacterium]|nr:GGDEF domain-containing protein [Gaiellaceae bacterium]
MAEYEPTTLFAGSIALGILCISLFVLALRRTLGRQEEVVTSMLARYDDRLVDFAQTLNDALNQTLPARITAAISGTVASLPDSQSPAPDRQLPEHGLMRLLELARERTSTDAAVAVVGNAASEPMLATVGLSETEAAQVGNLGVPDYRGARAIQVSFNGDPESSGRAVGIRAGLAVPLLDESERPGMLAVLTRSSDKRFSEIDITTLEDVLSVTRPGLETALELREPDPVPERDPLTNLYDRPAFHALLEREIVRARRARDPLAMLVLDVDRLTSLNARIGHLASDRLLARIAGLLRDVAGPSDLSCRVGGGRFAILLPRGDSRDAERLFERLQSELRQHPFEDAGVATVSGGVAELLPTDDAAALIVRADAALGLAKGAGRDTVVTAAKRG